MASLTLVTGLAFENPIRGGIEATFKRQDQARRAGTTASEDHLNMRVLTPAAFGTEKLPVIIWRQSGSNPDQESALVKGGFVVVALTPGSPKYSQDNWAAALKWVDRNIAAYGGDPKRVAIFDEMTR